MGPVPWQLCFMVKILRPPAVGPPALTGSWQRLPNHYPTGRPRHRCLQCCVSAGLVSKTGALQECCPISLSLNPPCQKSLKKKKQSCSFRECLLLGHVPVLVEAALAHVKLMALPLFLSPQTAGLLVSLLRSRDIMLSVWPLLPKVFTFS